MRFLAPISLILLSIKTFGTARADFEETPPKPGTAPSKPHLIVPPKATATPIPKSSPGASQTPTQAPSQIPAPPQASEGVIPPKSSTAPSATQPQQPASSSSGGDFLSGNSFTDVKHDTSQPVAWKSENLQGSRAKNMLTLTDKVVVTQGDLKMNSAIMDIHTIPGTTKPQRFVARRDVYIQKVANPLLNEFIEAWANEMEYSLETGIMILRKNAKIKRGSNCTITGDILNYDVREGTISGKFIQGSCLPPPQKPAFEPTPTR